MESSTEILQLVHAFYSDSFNKLITLTVALLALVGGVIPIIVTIIQNKQLKKENSIFKNHIDICIEDAAKELEKKIKRKFETERVSLLNKATELEHKIEQQSAEAEASIFHLQGNQEGQNEHFDLAIISLADAGLGYIKCNDELNLRRVSTSIIEDCLPKLSKDAFEGDKEIEVNIKLLIKKLDDIDENGRYHDLINELRDQLHQAKSRTIAKENQSEV